MNKIIATVLSAAAVMLLLTIPISAADSGYVEKETSVISDSKNYDFSNNFEKKINENGKEYELADINTEIVKEISETKSKEYSLGFDYEKKAVKVGDEVEVNGSKVIVTKVTYKEKKTTERIGTANTNVDYGYCLEKPKNIPNTTEVEYFDKQTNNTLTVSIPISEVKEDAWQWVDDFSANFTITGVDYPYYEFEGETIPSNDYPAIRDYENLIYKHLKINDKQYRIESVEWNGEKYNNNGEMCRDVTVKGARYAARFTAYYSGSFDLPETTGWETIVEYNDTSVSANSAIKYELRGVAKYKEIIPTMTTAQKVIIGISIVLVIIIVGAIFIIAKRKKKKSADVEVR